MITKQNKNPEKGPSGFPLCSLLFHTCVRGVSFLFPLLSFVWKFFFLCVRHEVVHRHCKELSNKRAALNASSWMRRERFSFSHEKEDSASGTRTEVPKLALAFKRTCLLFWVSRCGCWAADTTKQSRKRRTTSLERERGQGKHTVFASV